MEKYNTVIVGAGPGGLHCAKILAENDEDFILFERKSEFDHKICTGLWGISEKTKYMSLPDKLFEKKFSKATFSTQNKKVEVRYKEPFVATLNRKELSEYMYKQALRAGANIEFGANVKSIGKKFLIVNDRKVYFENLIGADGSSSIVRRSLGLSKDMGMGIQYWVKKEYKYIECHFDADKFGPWYSWIAPHRGVTSIGAGSDPKVLPMKRLKENLDSWCRERNIPIENAEYEGAPINYHYEGYKFGNKYLVGDAAGFTSGLTGEGIYFAMASGEDVAKMILNSRHKPALINKVLSIKKKHEMIAKTFQLNKTMEKIEQGFILELLKFKSFDKFVIDLIA